MTGVWVQLGRLIKTRYVRQCILPAQREQIQHPPCAGSQRSRSGSGAQKVRDDLPHLVHLRPVGVLGTEHGGSVFQQLLHQVA